MAAACGYRTALVGKYLHGYVDTAAKSPAPGWDKWYAMLRPFKYFKLKLGVNGKVVRFPNRARDYLTSVLSRYAVRFVRRSAPRKRPFFLWFTPWAPHESHHSVRQTPTSGGREATVATEPRSRRRATTGRSSRHPFRSAVVRRGGRQRQARLHPPFPPLRSAGSAHAPGQFVQRYRCRLASLPAVDRGIKRLLETLEKAGELDNTVIVFTSDNGFFGEHRLALGKNLPYEEAIRVPLMIRVPTGVSLAAPGGVVHQPVANIDLAPTLLELARAQPCISSTQCRVMDGRSLVPLLQGDTSRGPRTGASWSRAGQSVRRARAASRHHTRRVGAPRDDRRRE